MDNQQSIALVWAHAFANAPAIPVGFHEAEENMTWPPGNPSEAKPAIIEKLCRATGVGEGMVEEHLDGWVKSGVTESELQARFQSGPPRLTREVLEYVTKARAWQKEALWAKQQFELGRLFNWRRTFATKAVEGFRAVATAPAEAEEERA
jgi:predicted carbohydrate-binding protein with CBM5 and CBM33 domain